MKKIMITSSLILLIVFISFCFIHDDKELIGYNDTNQDIDKMVGVYLEDENGEYVSSSDIPSKDDGYEFNKAVCENDIEVKWNEDAWSLIVPNNIANFKCNLYFDNNAKETAKDTIVANYGTVLTRNTFNNIVTDTTTGTIYKSLDESQYDNDGEVYYFVGNPTDNWVKFGGFYWRIIRINGNGSIRMIYQGTSAYTIGAITQLQTNVFNSTSSDNMYVGYMYGSGVHGLTSSSTIKEILDNWYRDNLAIDYGDKIDGSAGFCGDREPSTGSLSSDGQGGTGTTTTYYGAYIRLHGSNKVPTFECKNTSDLYTSSGSGKGNGTLTYPIGLITMDEVWYAGGNIYNNTSFYLYTRQIYWTMSPYSYYSRTARVFRVDSDGAINGSIVNSENAIRPVINLKADVKITGSGTTTDPYVVS